MAPVVPQMGHPLISSVQQEIPKGFLRLEGCMGQYSSEIAKEDGQLPNTNSAFADIINLS